MRITFVSPQVSQGGGSRVLAIYALGLRNLGHDVKVISRFPNSPSRKRQLYDSFRGKPNYYDPAYSKFFDPLGDDHIQLPFGMPPQADDFPEADVLVATWWRTAFEVASMPPEKGRKAYLVQGHETFHKAEADLAHGSYFLPLRKIVVSSWLEQIMTEQYGTEHCFRVANAVDLDQFDAPPRSRNTSPTIGFIYSRTDIKGVDTALKALDQLENPPRVVAFGHGKPSSDLPLPPNSVFTHLPGQDKIPKLYASCDVWLCPSRNEGFGLPILEAMACRTPVIATRTGAADDLIINGENGYVVDVDDVDAMTQRIEDLLALPPAGWKAMSDAAYAKARARSWKDAIRELETVLEAIANGK